MILKWWRMYHQNRPHIVLTAYMPGLLSRVSMMNQSQTRGKISAQTKPHQETGCWAIDTEYNGQRSKYVMVARQVQAK